MKVTLLKIYLKLVIILNHTNLPINLIYIFSALSTRPGPIECLILIIELFQMVYFQFKILSIFRARRNSKMSQVKNYRDKVYVEGSYIFEIDVLITIPMGLYLNAVFLVKLLTVFAFRTSPEMFSLVFIFESVFFLAATYKMVSKGGYFKMIKLVLIIMLIESAMICLICFTVFSDRLYYS
jgi:hypothetical protein